MVLSLAAGGLGLTSAGLVAGTADITGRIQTYRKRERRAADAMRAHHLDPVRELLHDQQPFLISQHMRRLERAMVDAEERIGAAAGTTQNLRRLWFSAAIAIFGVMLSGTADIVAAVHAH